MDPSMKTHRDGFNKDSIHHHNLLEWNETGQWPRRWLLKRIALYPFVADCLCIRCHYHSTTTVPGPVLGPGLANTWTCSCTWIYSWTCSYCTLFDLTVFRLRMGTQPKVWAEFTPSGLRGQKDIKEEELTGTKQTEPHVCASPPPLRRHGLHHPVLRFFSFPLTFEPNPVRTESKQADSDKKLRAGDSPSSVFSVTF